MEQPIEELRSEKVGEKDRSDAIYKAFGPSNIHIEMCSYKIADRMYAGYTGGHWEYWKVNNGGFYATLDEEGPIKVESLNGESHDLSADAAGLALWITAMSWISSAMADTGSQDLVGALVNNYNSLRDYACKHEEREAIFAILD